MSQHVAQITTVHCPTLNNGSKTLSELAICKNTSFTRIYACSLIMTHIHFVVRERCVRTREKLHAFHYCEGIKMRNQQSNNKRSQYTHKLGWILPRIRVQTGGQSPHKSINMRADGPKALTLGEAVFDLRDSDCTTFVEVHLAMPHAKFLSSLASKREILKFYLYISRENMWPLGRGQFWSKA